MAEDKEKKDITEEYIQLTTEQPTVKSRKGRKPTPTSGPSAYFGDNEEKAVVEYLKCKDPEERKKIYEAKLAKPMSTLVESIIRRYNLYLPDETFRETYADAMVFLVTKLDKFDPTRGHKAYSYCGTITKNYLIARINKAKRLMTQNYSYDESSVEINNDIRFSYQMDEQAPDLTALIDRLIDEINSQLSPAKINKLTPNEQKVGQALVNFLMNWEEIFQRMGSDKLNRSAFQYFLKETTLLPPKEIKEAMKKFKSLYLLVKEEGVE